jgi:hypothetical protein
VDRMLSRGSNAEASNGVACCPQLLVVSIFGKLEPTAACLEALGAHGKELATVVTRFPQILVQSVEEKVVSCTCIP